MLLSSLLSALAMWCAIYLIRGKGVPCSLKPVLLVSFSIAVLGYFALNFFGVWGLLLTLGVLVFLLGRSCDLSLPVSLVAGAVWLAVQVLFGWFLGPIY